MPKTAMKVLLLAIALVAVGVAFVRFNRVTLPEGPVPVVWDAEVCTHCKMHVGDPRFAAQVQTQEGDVLNFDEVSVHAIYFRNHEADGWLSEAEVGFLPADDSPMGYGIRAVPKSASGAQSIDWARTRVMERPHNQHGAHE